MINTAIVGCGYWGSILKRYIELNKELRLIQVCDSKTDLNAVFANAQLDAVVVATPIETHYKIVREALLRGKHVLSEKPLALRASECLELKRLAEENGVVLETDYVFTFSKGLQKAKEVVDSCYLGRLLAFEGSTKHLGRFGRQSVYWLLASHLLSVLGMFVSLGSLQFKFVDLVKGETGSILFSGGLNGRIDVSLNFPWKETEVILYCESGTLRYTPHPDCTVAMCRYLKPSWVVAEKIPKVQDFFSFDESNNLRFVFANFADLINGKGVGNADLACEITKIIEEGAP